MADSTSKKRSTDDTREQPGKRQKGQNDWWKQNGRRLAKNASKPTIENGDSGIFVSCNKGRENRCTAEILDLLSQEVPDPAVEVEDDEDAVAESGDIEEQIKKEIEQMQQKRSSNARNSRFQLVKLDIPCLLFIKTATTISPVDIVHRLCIDALENPERKRSRWVQRLTPITSTRKLLGGGIEELSREVLKPHFHSGGPPKKYAIRPSIRNNSDWHKETVIKLVAGIVGPDHSVDLKNYDLLILVDVFKNWCGMSVVGEDYDKLKRYNIAEIYNPTPRPEPKT